MFAASKFGRRLPAICLQEQDTELLSQVNVELRQYSDNMDHVKCVAAFYLCLFASLCIVVNVVLVLVVCVHVYCTVK